MSDLSKLLRPRSIAVIGGGEWGKSIIRNSRKVGFEGAIWPVHPRLETVEGVPAFGSVGDLPGVPDAAYIAVNRHKTIEVVGELSAMGCGGVVCLASGFLEADAEDDQAARLQDALLEAAGDMTLVGPNCYGFVNYLDGAALWPDQQGGVHVESGVAIICQSSNIAMNISMQRRGVPLAYLGAAGNQAQTGLSAIGAAMLEDERVTALGLHIEGIDDIRGFEALAARARALGKPIIALKVGRSQQAQTAAVSHTASLAGSDAGSAAFLARLGIARVNSLPVFLETLKLLHVCGVLPSNRIASMSCSGGEASLMADTALAYDLEFPALEPVQHDGLRAALGPMVALSNPLDYHTYIWRNREKIGETFSAMMTGDLALGIVVLDYPRQDRCEAEDWYDITHGCLRARADNGTPMAIVSTIHECMPEGEALKLLAHGIAPMQGLDECLAAVEAAVWLGRAHERAAPVELPGEPRDAVLVGEVEAKAALAGFGLAVPKGMRVETPGAAAHGAGEIGGAVVLKGLGHAHKTEAGAVKVGLRSDEVESAAGQMGGDAFLVEEMIGGSVVELLVGVVRDPAHGFVLTIGAGGQLTELLGDRGSLLVPASREAVETCLEGLRCATLVNGYRGGKPADKGAIVDAVMAVQKFVLAHSAGLEEVEINPLIATPDRAVAVDALLRWA